MISTKQLIVAGALMEMSYASLFLTSAAAADVGLFLIIHTFCYLLLAALLWGAGKGEPEAVVPYSATIILGFAVLFRLTLCLHDPVMSDDMYRYLWDGKVAADGRNPFALAPDDPGLVHLHSGDLPARITFPEMRTIYPPLAQVLFRTSHMFFGDSVTGMKFLLICADILTMLLLLKWAKGQKTRLRPFLLYAWSPLPVLYIALDGHVDGLGIPFLVAFVLLLTTQREVTSALALGFASLAKLYPLFLIPFLWKFSRRARRLTAAIPLALLACGYAFYYEPSGGIVESLLVYNMEFSFNGPVFTIFNSLIHSNIASHITCAALFLLWIVVLCLLSRPLFESALLTFLGFLILSPTVHPWYFCWLAPLLVLRWSLSVFVLLGFSNVSNVVVYWSRLGGAWEESHLLLVVEYVPFLALFAWEVARGKIIRTPRLAPTP